VVYLLATNPALVEWHEETGFDAWNAYRGDMAVLRATGVYTQGDSGLAWRACGLGVPSIEDTAPVPPGNVVFYLVSGSTSGVEGGLGTDSAGFERPNDNPCP
jgi:hypothetical protein